jgi:hypothetical protein
MVNYESACCPMCLKGWAGSLLLETVAHGGETFH